MFDAQALLAGDETALADAVADHDDHIARKHIVRDPLRIHRAQDADGGGGGVELEEANNNN